jgi:hypothetical protein
MKLKNMVIGEKVERKSPFKYFVTVTHLNRDENSFSGVVVHAGNDAPYEDGDYIEGMHPKYFKSVSIH